MDKREANEAQLSYLADILTSHRAGDEFYLERIQRTSAGMGLDKIAIAEEDGLALLNAMADSLRNELSGGAPHMENLAAWRAKKESERLSQSTTVDGLPSAQGPLL